jgi:hypothetical protein
MSVVQRFNPCYANVATGFRLKHLLQTKSGRLALCFQSSLLFNDSRMTILAIGNQFMFLVNEKGIFFIGGIDGDTIHVCPAPPAVFNFLNVFPKDVVKNCSYIDKIVPRDYARADKVIGEIFID